MAIYLKLEPSSLEYWANLKIFQMFTNLQSFREEPSQWVLNIKTYKVKVTWNIICPFLVHFNADLSLTYVLLFFWLFFSFIFYFKTIFNLDPRSTILPYLHTQKKNTIHHQTNNEHFRLFNDIRWLYRELFVTPSLFVDWNDSNRERMVKCDGITSSQFIKKMHIKLCLWRTILFFCHLCAKFRFPSKLNYTQPV